MRISDWSSDVCSSDLMHTHFRGLAEVVTEKANGGLVIDIGYNDGLMLMAANGMGARTLGIDPAANIVEIANERGVDVHVAYVNPATAAGSEERRVGKECVSPWRSLWEPVQ